MFLRVTDVLVDLLLLELKLPLIILAAITNIVDFHFSSFVIYDFYIVKFVLALSFPFG